MNKFTIAIAALGLATLSPAVTLFDYGHADIGIGYSNGSWDLHFHDDTNNVEYEPDEVQIRMFPYAVPAYGVNSSLENRAASPLFNFIGVGAGQPYFRLRETAATGRPFIGFGTEETDATFPAVAYTESDPRVGRIWATNPDVFVSLELVSVDGPDGGVFSLWSNDPGDGNGPVVWISTLDGISSEDRYVLPDDVHAHTNFGFTREGVYDVTFRARIWDGGAWQYSPNATYSFNAVPEPASVLALGAGALALVRRRKKS